MVSGLIQSHWKLRPKTLLQGVVGWEGWCASGLMGSISDAEIDGLGVPAWFISLHGWQMVKFQVLTSLSSDLYWLFLRMFFFLNLHTQIYLWLISTCFRVFVKAKGAIQLYSFHNVSQLYSFHSSQFCPVNREQLSYFFWLFFFLAAKAAHWVFYWSDRLCFRKACFWPAVKSLRNDSGCARTAFSQLI